MVGVAEKDGKQALAAAIDQYEKAMEAFKAHCWAMSEALGPGSFADQAFCQTKGIFWYGLASIQSEVGKIKPHLGAGEVHNAHLQRLVDTIDHERGDRLALSDVLIAMDTFYFPKQVGLLPPGKLEQRHFEVGEADASGYQIVTRRKEGEPTDGHSFRLPPKDKRERVPDFFITQPIHDVMEACGNLRVACAKVLGLPLTETASVYAMNANGNGHIPHQNGNGHAHGVRAYPGVSALQ